MLVVAFPMTQLTWVENKYQPMNWPNSPPLPCRHLDGHSLGTSIADFGHSRCVDYGEDIHDREYGFTAWRIHVLRNI